MDNYVISADRDGDAHLTLRDVIDDLLAIRSNWAIYFIKALSDARIEGQEVLSSVELYTAAYRLRYDRECHVDHMAANQMTVRAAIRNGWKKIDAGLGEEISNLLSSRTNKDGSQYSVSFLREAGTGSGNLSTFSYALLSESAEEGVKEQEDELGLTYRSVAMPRLPFYSRWLIYVPERGLANTAYWSLLSVSMLAGSVLAASIIKNHSGALMASTLIACGLGSMAACVLPFYSVLRNKSALAPFWMQGARPSLLLEQGFDKENSKSIRLVAYKGSCPICDSEVELRGGGVRHVGRIVGKCARNPREHIYSFDHVTKRGYKI